MTRETAIMELAGMYRVVITDDLEATVEAKRKNEAIDMAIAALEQRKQGRWVFHDDDLMPWVSCSECGCSCYNIDKTDYCPKCGAKMEEASE